MPKGDFLDLSENQNWNVASDYVKLKIMKPLYELDILGDIALYGTSDLFSEFEIEQSPNFKNLSRMKGISRLLSTLSLLISNTIFAVKKNDRDKLQAFLDDLKTIKAALPCAQKTNTDERGGGRRSIVSINEVVFDKLLSMLLDIKVKLNTHLNDAHLIFTSNEEFDLKKLKQDVTDRLLTGGA